MSKDLVPWQQPALVDRLRRRLPELKFRPSPPPVVRRVGRAVGAAVKREARAQLADMFDVVEDRREERRQERICSRQRRRYRDDLPPGNPGTNGVHYIGKLYVLRPGGMKSELGMWALTFLLIFGALALGGVFDRAPEPVPAPIVQPIRTEDI